MVTDKQVRILRKLIQTEKTLAIAAAKAGMCEKTARKYSKSGKLPSEVAPTRYWRNRPDPFVEDWDEVREFLRESPGFQAKTLFEYLQRQNPGRYQDGQLRTLQRRVKIWRATEGPPREVFFDQTHHPGRLSQSDFTHMGDLDITIAGIPFDHMIYHFILSYSNWETGTVCHSESFESLSEGLQNALWELGGVPELHQTDRLSTAVHKVDHPDEFTQRYQALMDHNKIEGRKIRVREPHENGDVEQSHYRFKTAVEQALLLRGSRDFSDLAAYRSFLRSIFRMRNAGRSKRFAEELPKLKSLPERRLESRKRIRTRVGRGSTVRLAKNVYSVHSRLIGETVDAWLGADQIEIWYGQKKIDQFPRLRGTGKRHINYRHIIDWLVRKPGAFENYRYREELFPTTYFRMAYDSLCGTMPTRSSKEYLSILYMAAMRGEGRVNEILSRVLGLGHSISAVIVERALNGRDTIPRITEVRIDRVNLAVYDEELRKEVTVCIVAS